MLLLYLMEGDQLHNALRAPAKLAGAPLLTLDSMEALVTILDRTSGPFSDFPALNSRPITANLFDCLPL